MVPVKPLRKLDDIPPLGQVFVVIATPWCYDHAAKLCADLAVWVTKNAPSDVLMYFDAHSESASSEVPEKLPIWDFCEMNAASHVPMICIIRDRLLIANIDWSTVVTNQQEPMMSKALDEQLQNFVNCKASMENT